MVLIPEFCRASLLALVLCLGLAHGGALASAGQGGCDLPGVKIVAVSAQDAADACHGARQAIHFFAGQGLRTDTPIEIHVQNEFPPDVSPSAAGCFYEREGKVLLRPYARFQASRTWFKVPISRALYRSLATHEVAHALATCNFGVPKPSIQAREYVAYAVMFSTMEPALRERILKAQPGVAPDTDRITELLFVFDPMRFGVQAYRHHVLPQHGLPFLQAVLAGKELAE